LQLDPQNELSLKYCVTRAAAAAVAGVAIDVPDIDTYAQLVAVTAAEADLVLYP